MIALPLSFEIFLNHRCCSGLRMAFVMADDLDRLCPNILIQDRAGLSRQEYLATENKINEGFLKQR